MSEDLIRLIGLVSVLTIGTVAQWASWRLRLPAILLLLLFGFLAGPMSQFTFGHPWIDPDDLFGNLLFPFISASVAIILFEGGLSLKRSELGSIGKALRNLISIGVAVTWLMGTAAAHFVLGFEWSLALLLGAILIVTGPTVIIPLLRQVRPEAKINSLLKWEGILNDPIGAVIAVLVFESIVAQQSGEAASGAAHALYGVAVTLIGAGLIGVLGAAVLILPLRKYWIPDYLQSPVTLTLVLVVFAASNAFQAESGLLAVTVMGVVLANQKFVGVKHIIEFKENLRVLLITVLFILLAARVDVAQIQSIDAWSVVFLFLVIFVIRPASVFASMIRSGFTWKQRLFVGLTAPRGIVAAAVTSLFAIHLTDAGMESAEELVPIVFLVIVGTIVFCGALSRPMARWLGLAAVDPQGVLFVGAHDWAREIAAALKKQGVAVVMIDTNATNARAARMAGLPCRKGSIFNDELVEDLDLSQIKRLLTLTPNDEANALAAAHLIEVFGRKEVYQLPPFSESIKDQNPQESQRLRGRNLFQKDATFIEISRRFAAGAAVKATQLTDEFTFEAFQRRYGDNALPMFLLSDAAGLEVWASDSPPKPAPGKKLISLVSADE